MEGPQENGYRSNYAARILLVDDSIPYGKLIKHRLERVGMQVDFIDNPVVALEHARTREYDCIVVDFHMPQMYGTEFIYAIHALDHLRDRPVLMETASDPEEIKAQWKDRRGMPRIMTKQEFDRDPVQTIEELVRAA